MENTQLPLPQLLIFFVSIGQLDPISFIVSWRRNRDKSYFLKQSLKVYRLGAIVLSVMRLRPYEGA